MKKSNKLKFMTSSVNSLCVVKNALLNCINFVNRFTSRLRLSYSLVHTSVDAKKTNETSKISNLRNCCSNKGK